MVILLRSYLINFKRYFLLRKNCNEKNQDSYTKDENEIFIYLTLNQLEL